MNFDVKNNSEAKSSRRKWLDLMLTVGGGLWISGMLAPVLAYLWPAKSRGPVRSNVKVGSVDDFPVGSSKMVHEAGQPILVIRSSAAQFKAFSAICTHLGCIVAWDKDRRVITCPCHAAVFSAEGKVISGPPPKPLNEYPIMIIGKEILVKI